MSCLNFPAICALGCISLPSEQAPHYIYVVCVVLAEHPACGSRSISSRVMHSLLPAPTSLAGLWWGFNQTKIKALEIECLIAPDPLLQVESRQLSPFKRGFFEWRRQLLPSLTPLPQANGVFLCSLAQQVGLPWQGEKRLEPTEGKALICGQSHHGCLRRDACVTQSPFWHKLSHFSELRRGTWAPGREPHYIERAQNIRNFPLWPHRT